MRRLTFFLIVALLVCLVGSVALADRDPKAAAMAGTDPELTTFWGGGGIAICWDKPASVPETAVIQYMIWRDAPGRLSRGDIPIIGMDSMAMPPFYPFDHSFVDGYPVYSYTYLSVNKKGDLYPIQGQGWGAVPGDSHKYWVSALCRKTSRKGKISYEEIGPIHAGRATLLNRPIPRGPGDVMSTVPVDLKNVTFEWYGCKGADQYVIEVSPTPDFARDKTWVGEVYRPTGADGQLLSKRYANTLSKSKELKDLPPGSTLYWRVGARNSCDVPGPIAAGPSPTTRRPKETTYIYCDMSQCYSFVTPAAAPSAVAMAGVSPDITSGYGDGGNLVAWNNPSGIRQADIVEFHIWRDCLGSGIDQGGSECGPVMVIDAVSVNSMNTPVGSFDYSGVDSILSREGSYLTASQDHTTLDAMDCAVGGIGVGTPHQYWITCLYKRLLGGQVTYWETEAVYAGRATYLNRPECDSPGGMVASDYADLSNITFRWRGSAGADQYVIEVSPTPDFKRDETWVDVIYQPTAADQQLFTKTYANVLKDADTGAVVSELANVPAGGTLYWRVGARNRMDTPGPYPAGPSPQVDGPKNTRYIYCDMSQYYSFMTLPDLPGPPPDSRELTCTIDFVGAINDNNHYYIAIDATGGGDGPRPGFGPAGWLAGSADYYVEYHQGQYTLYRVLSLEPFQSAPIGTPVRYTLPGVGGNRLDFTIDLDAIGAVGSSIDLNIIATDQPFGSVRLLDGLGLMGASFINVDITADRVIANSSLVLESVGDVLNQDAIVQPISDVTRPIDIADFVVTVDVPSGDGGGGDDGGDPPPPPPF